MAIGAIAAHKLRSALTLLGVLVGVFSIIVVMTAMRVMQSNIERAVERTGQRTFMIRKWPSATSAFHGDFEKYWRRKNITMAKPNGCGKNRPAGQHRPGNRCFGREKSQPATKPARRPCGFTAKLPAVFPRITGIWAKAGCCWMRIWTARAISACWATGWPRIFSPKLGPRRTGQD